MPALNPHDTPLFPGKMMSLYKTMRCRVRTSPRFRPDLQLTRQTRPAGLLARVHSTLTRVVRG